MDRWDVAIMVGAGYVAIMSLVRLMRHRRNTLVEHIRNQITSHSSSSSAESDSSADQDAA